MAPADVHILWNKSLVFCSWQFPISQLHMETSVVVPLLQCLHRLRILWHSHIKSGRKNKKNKPIPCILVYYCNPKYLPCQKCVNITGTSFFLNACICEKTSGIKLPPLGVYGLQWQIKLHLLRLKLNQAIPVETFIENDSTHNQIKTSVMPTWLPREI